jgi:hypothetical protein
VKIRTLNGRGKFCLNSGAVAKLTERDEETSLSCQESAIDPE